jgi:FAD:protein FMN transferase
MGTSWSVRVVGDGERLRPEIEAVLARIVAEMSHWVADSAISRFNRAEPGRWQPLPPGFATVLDAALAVARLSGGAFDPAMGLLADRWGFGPSGPRAEPPAEPIVADALAVSGWRRIEQDGRRARRLEPAALDLSGIAKGYAVDAVADRLRGLGHSDFLVEIGGELRGEGIKPDGQPWWVELEQAPGAPVAPFRVALHGLSVATSGDYRRAFVHAGRRYAHTLDPRTGRPLDNGVASVSVLHPSCMMADAWATALGVLGPAGLTIAEAQGLAAHMAVCDGMTLREHISPALQVMLK